MSQLRNSLWQCIVHDLRELCMMWRIAKSFYIIQIESTIMHHVKEDCK